MQHADGDLPGSVAPSDGGGSNASPPAAAAGQIPASEPVRNGAEPEAHGADLAAEPTVTAAPEDASGAELVDSAEGGAEPSDAELVARLQQLLKEVDLGVTSEKMLRKKLEAEFGCDLSSKKALVRGEVMAYLDAQEPAAEGEAAVGSEDEEGEGGGGGGGTKRGRGGASRFGDHLSAAMQAFLGVERCPRTQVVKKMWEYIKAHDLQDPKDRRRVLLDDRMKTIFPGKSVTMFTMQKHLSKHVYVDDTVQEESSEEEEEADEEEEEAPPAKQAKRASGARKPAAPAKRASGKRKPAADGAPPKPNGFTKPLRLSEEMAAWVGKPEASRPEITKHLWSYVKERELQDPANRQWIVADATLKKLTGEAKFKGFSFSALIKKHFLG